MLVLVIILLAMGVLAFHRASITVWTISIIVGLLLLGNSQVLSLLPLTFISLLAFIVLLPLNVKPLRQKLFSKKLFKLFKKQMPRMSSTEKEALEAGTVSFEGELFTGNPDYKKLFSLPKTELRDDENAFLQGPVKTLCSMLEEWDITHHRTDLPPEVWEFIKKERFLGMIIPKKYGGLEFSATAQAAVLVSVYSKSVSAATTISVPNSLGPAELLLKYGTEEQKDYYLPRLAIGQEIPCFALTSPNAGSDAASMPDTGVVCKGQFKEKEVLGIRLNWDKRYITLSPVATVIGLAFRLFDPDGYLGDTKEIGITCALIPKATEGVVTGRRHFPLNTAFLNGPTQGHDVFIPLDNVIGGEKMVGQGWRMLMECLSAGRAISLPSTAVGGGQLAALTSGAYARVRKQFNTAIANFEGIQEALARIAGYNYIINSALFMTTTAIDEGAKPAVASAILKYHTTELGRLISIDAMDIHGGKGICLGPKNYIGRGYQNAPISITVEGANILTRSLIIFGQGAIRCHPYVLKTFKSLEHNDIKAFDDAIFAHAGLIISNFVRTFTYSITDGRLSNLQYKSLAPYLQKISKYSAQFAFLADFCMLRLGAALKRKEFISARLGDLLSYLYLSSSVVKRFKDSGQSEDEKKMLDWCTGYLFSQLETKMSELVNNLPGLWSRCFLKISLFPLGFKRRKPIDKLSAQLARILTTDNPLRDDMTRYVYKENVENNPIAVVETAFRKLIACEEIEKTISKAYKKGELKSLTLLQQIDEALEKGLIDKRQAQKMHEAESFRQRVIAVDDFSFNELRSASSENTQKSTTTRNEKKEVV